MIVKFAENYFSMSGGIEKGSIPLGPLSSTPILSFVRGYDYECQTSIICILMLIITVREDACCVVVWGEGG